MSQTFYTMRIFVVAICICGVLGRPEGGPVKRATPIQGGQQSQSSTPFPQVPNDVLESALKDRRFVERQLKCATGTGPCDPIGRKLKVSAPLVLRGMCAKCSPTEVKQVERVLSHLQTNYPTEYSKIIKEYQSQESKSTGDLKDKKGGA
ncbi:ejaculatory bulb-specific protein 3-like [Adelges cooleyi]|uniref:ejaculatory bulb-specific protein 3-like n=1 Tax=Adelges cooleyi TaxID=133065 RepID=UPI00218073B5|nr:ejaculatory bulb-specific protein 3-like [Adelges cooleyi]